MKIKILVNDGLSEKGKDMLIAYGYELIEKHIAQKNLIRFINEHKISVLLVRSATKVRKDIIDKCKSIQIIGRGGVGMDNIDVEYAKKNGIKVINTPNASSLSVAELVFAHLFSLTRNIYHSNRTMPLEADFNFKKLKEKYSNGKELKGKKIGIIGFGRIGVEVAKIAIGIGMHVLFYDPYVEKKIISIEFFNNKSIEFELKKTDFGDLLKQSDVITIHIPKQNKALINKKELQKMKKGSLIINTSRGGIVNEKDLVNFLNNKHIESAGLDVFENEPSPHLNIVMHESISLSPHIGASTIEAQEKIGIELAEQINNILNG